MKRRTKDKREYNTLGEYIRKLFSMREEHPSPTIHSYYYKAFPSKESAFQLMQKVFYYTGETQLSEEQVSLKKFRDFLLTYSSHAKYEWSTGTIERLSQKLNQLDKRTLSHSSTLEKHEANIERLKEGKRASVDEEVVPQYLSEDFIKLIDHLRNLEEAVGNNSKLLYYLMEAEVVLGELEEKARCTDRKYEARLSASLRDICRLHEPSNISEEQINVFAASNRALMDGWGKLNREKLAWIRSELLKVGLTWLPVTDKAAKEVSKAQSMTE